MQTEFHKLDNYLNINEPNLILLGGVKDVGKTTFLINIASNFAIHQNIPVLFFSLEEDYIRADMKELNYGEFTKQIKDLPNNFSLSDKIILKEISSKIHFANYNIIIHNNSDYPSETKNKLVEFLYKLLKNNKIIEKGYEFITIDDIGKKTEKVKTRIGFAV